MFGKLKKMKMKTNKRKREKGSPKTGGYWIRK